MAGKNIKGITIEIDGNATGLDKALKSVNGTSVKLNSELKDVNKLLKFDPSNATLLAQKQELLTKSIDNTTTKLESLKSAQAQVEEQFKSGKIGEEQYRAFQRELTQTEQSLKSYESQLAKMQSEQQKLGQNTDRLNTYFEASGKSIDDFSDILGTRLVNAIKDGTATSDQLEMALNKIGREALGADGDISKFKSTLDGVRSGESIEQVRSDLENLSPAANEAESSIDNMAQAITGGNMINAGEAISGIGDKIIELGGHAKDTALEFSSSFGSLNATTDLTGQELQNLKNVATDVFKSGVVDNIDEAVQATSTMKSAFSDLNDQDLGLLTEQVITLSSRTGTDVQENVRGASQLMNAFGLDAQSAFNLVASGYQNNLNVSGDFTDTLVEYSPLFAEAGYSADRMLQTLKNGMDAGAMNTDKVADAVKEVQVRLGDGSFEENLSNFSEETQVTFQKWKEGKATVSEVMASITQDLNEVDPSKQQELLSIISTQFEDLGIKGAQGLSQIGTSFNDVGESMESASEKDPSQEWQASWNELQASLQAIGTDLIQAFQPILDVIAQLAESFSNLPEPVRMVIEVIGGILAVVTLLMPIIASFSIVLPVLGGAFAAIGTAVGAVVGVLSGPLIAIIGVVIGVIIGIIAVIKNWGAIVDWLQSVWQSFSDWISGLWQGISSVASSVWSAISSFISEMISSCVSTVQNLWSNLSSFLSSLWQGISNVASSIWNGITSVISGAINTASSVVSSVVNGISSVVSSVWNGIKSLTESVWNGIKSAMTSPIEAAKKVISGIVDTIKGLFNFKLSFPKIEIPHIPLPHFSLKGSFNPLKGQIPSIGIDWFANGGILTKPTIFGMNGNRLMAGGEAGKEAVAPLSDLMAYVEKAVANQFNKNNSIIFVNLEGTVLMDGKSVGVLVAPTVKIENDRVEVMRNKVYRR